MNIKNIIPNDWKLVNLSEITELITKGTTPTTNGYPYLDDGVNFVKVESIHANGTFIPKMFAHVGEDCHVSFKRSQLRNNDILFTIAGALGRSAIVINEILPANTNQAVAIIRLKNTEYLNYIFHYLRGNYVKNLIDKINVSTAQANLSLGQINQFEIPLPPLPEQQKIAEILSTVDDKIEVIDQQIIETQALKKGLMQRLLTKGIGHTEFKDSPLGVIPQSWEVVKLEEVCLPKEGMRRGPFGGAIKKEYFVDKGYQVYEQRNAIYDDFTTARYFINEEKYEELKAFKVVANDFIISCSGTIGKIAKVPNDFKEGVINQALLRLRLKSNTIDDDFFLQQFRFEPFQNKITDSTQGGAMKNLVGMSEFRKSLIVLPKIKEQKTIAQILTLVDNKLDVLSEKKNHYQELKQGLMQQLLTGKIRVNI